MLKLIRKIKRFLINLWEFKKELWRFRKFDYSFNVDLFCKSILLSADFIDEYGNEINETRLPKVRQMRRFVQLVEDYRNALELAQKELGKEWQFSKNLLENHSLVCDPNETNTEISNKSTEIEKKCLAEIQDILFNENCENGKNILSWWD